MFNRKLWPNIPDNLKDEDEVYLNIEDFNQTNLETIINKNKNCKIFINTAQAKLYVKDIKNAEEAINYLKNTHKKEAVFANYHFGPDDKWSVQKALNAASKLDGWEQEVKNAKKDGQPLSNLEKYAYIYSIVTDFIYNESEKDKTMSRDLIGVLNSDNIVCVGYAHLLKELCDRVGIECEVQQVIAQDGGKEVTSSNHANCCVRIKDEKYGIDMLVYADPCWDSKKEDRKARFNHAFIKYDELPKIYGERVVVDVCEYVEQVVEKNLVYNKPENVGDIFNPVYIFDENLKQQYYAVKQQYDKISQTIDFDNCSHEEFVAYRDISSKLSGLKNQAQKQLEDYKNRVLNIVDKYIEHYREQLGIQQPQQSSKNFTHGAICHTMITKAALNRNYNMAENEEQKQDYKNICNSIVFNSHQLKGLLQNTTNEDIKKQIVELLENELKNNGMVTGYNKKFAETQQIKFNSSTLTQEQFVEALTNVNIAKQNAERENQQKSFGNVLANMFGIKKFKTDQQIAEEAKYSAQEEFDYSVNYCLNGRKMLITKDNQNLFVKGVFNIIENRKTETEEQKLYAEQHNKQQELLKKFNYNEITESEYVEKYEELDFKFSQSFEKLVAEQQQKQKEEEEAKRKAEVEELVELHKLLEKEKQEKAEQQKQQEEEEAERRRREEEESNRKQEEEDNYKQQAEKEIVNEHKQKREEVITYGVSQQRQYKTEQQSQKLKKQEDNYEDLFGEVYDSENEQKMRL